MGPHLISLLRGARWEGAPGSAGAGAVAADRRRAIARSRRLSTPAPESDLAKKRAYLTIHSTEKG